MRNQDDNNKDEGWQDLSSYETSDDQVVHHPEQQNHAPHRRPLPEDMTPDQAIRYRAAERAKRNHRKKERQMIGLVIMVLLILFLAFFLIRSLLNEHQAQVNTTSPSELSVNSDASDAQQLLPGVESGVGESLPEGASDASPSQDTTEAETVAAGANGENHSPAADAYAYDTDDVKAAMYDGEDLPEGKVAFLTFDDGIDPESTPLLLDELKELGVPATFFMVGSTFKESNKEILERMWDEGHAIAFHSFDHDYDRMYPDRHGDADAILEEYEQSKAALQEVLGPEANSHVWRYPGGKMSWKDLDEANDRFAELGVKWIDWNSMTGDAEPKSRRPTTTEGQVDMVLSSWAEWGQPNAMTVLMHDGTSKSLTRESLGAIVAALKDEGFTFGILK